jgi:hypothetical protein
VKALQEFLKVRILRLIKGPFKKEGVLGTPKKERTAIGQCVPERLMGPYNILFEEFVLRCIETGRIKGTH